MEGNIRNILNHLNSKAKETSWFDFEVQGYKGGDLIIAGSADFTFGHSIEITFIDVSFASLKTEWSVNTDKPFLFLIDDSESRKLNLKYKIEQGNFVFKILSDDLQKGDAFYVIAKGLSINEDKVYYYKRENLAENERIAEWVHE